ncbi:MAG: pectate lyase [Verrucomicrobiales bacterium]|nr:pectate lyase [Verrucomicrobiales bacterium]
MIPRLLINFCYLFFIMAGIPAGSIADDRDVAVAEKILAFQRSNGGWPKNYDYDVPGTKAELENAISDRQKIEDATIDNGATFKEIQFLAKLYRKTEDPRYSKAANQGVDYLLEAQYENGGWPQFYPNLKGYYRRITFNDGAMIGVMTLLRGIVTRPGAYQFVTDSVRDDCKLAIEKGLDCMLKCQVKVDGRPAVWCAQHDEVSFLPTSARSYELATLSGSESVGIVRYLMGIEDPGHEVVAAIEGAVTWFEKSKLKGIRLESFTNRDGEKDLRVVNDEKASALWARFYDIDTNQPVFCSRDGVPQKNLDAISHERRNGYSWLGEYARDLLAKDFPGWKAERGLQ